MLNIKPGLVSYLRRKCIPSRSTFTRWRSNITKVIIRARARNSCTREITWRTHKPSNILISFGDSNARSLLQTTTGQRFSTNKQFHIGRINTLYFSHDCVCPRVFSLVEKFPTRKALSVRLRDYTSVQTILHFVAYFGSSGGEGGGRGRERGSCVISVP